MKKRLLLATVSTMVFVAFVVTGCKFMAGPPTAVERKFFDFETNTVPKIVLVTNTAFVTNYQTVTITNEEHKVVETQKEVLIPIYNVNQVTNFVEQIAWKPNTNAATVTQTAGFIGNAAAPGWGGVIAGVLGGLFGAWGKIRAANQNAARQKDTSGVLAQDIEVVREFLWTLPGGDKYDAALKQFMRAHQKEAGVVNNVVDLLKNVVDETDAKGQLTEIQSILTSMGVTPPSNPAA